MRSTKAIFNCPSMSLCPTLSVTTCKLVKVPELINRITVFLKTSSFVSCILSHLVPLICWFAVIFALCHKGDVFCRMYHYFLFSPQVLMSEKKSFFRNDKTYHWQVKLLKNTVTLLFCCCFVFVPTEMSYASDWMDKWLILTFELKCQWKLKDKAFYKENDWLWQQRVVFEHVTCLTSKNQINDGPTKEFSVET